MHKVIPQNNGIIILTVVLLVATWIALVLRLVVRGAILRSLGWDDAILFVTTLVFSALAGITIRACQLDIEAGPLHPDVVLELVTDLFASLTLYVIATITFKISLAFFFLRFLVSSWHRCLVIVSVMVFTVYSAAFLVVIYVNFGRPLELTNKIMHNTCTGSSCGSWYVVGPMAYCAALLNSLIDVVFAILPILFIRNTNIPTRSKLSICVLLGLGMISGIASVVRIPYIAGLNLNHDLYPSPAYVSASIVEVATAILTLSCAALRPLFCRSALTRGERLVSGESPSAVTLVEGNRVVIAADGVQVSDSRSMPQSTLMSGKSSEDDKVGEKKGHGILVTRELDVC